MDGKLDHSNSKADSPLHKVVSGDMHLFVFDGELHYMIFLPANPRGVYEVYGEFFFRHKAPYKRLTFSQTKPYNLRPFSQK